ncbi:MAG TPA: type II CAAX endopeptidase family protein [Propionibacteriaceae bacterium]|nr:type II CAAX endopeptidase family protein [Propionibacteriaceae bacterium]
MNALLAPRRRIIWVSWLIAALLFLAIGNGLVYGLMIPLTAGLLVLLAPGLVPSAGRHVDGRDIRAVLLLYIGVVGALYVAFQVFTVDRTLGLFLCYAAGLILGVVGPVIYTVWMRGRPLADLGLTAKNWRQAVGLGLVLGLIQFFLTLYGYDLPAPIDWVPLLTMSLMVGLFEAVFFRGFIQTRLSASLGPIPGVVAAAGLYALYHVGYGMGMREMAFLFGLGLVYGIAYACVSNVLVLWPVLIPLGSFYNNLQSGGIELPWAAIAGFVDVMAIMFAAIWIAHRRERRAVKSTADEASDAVVQV